MFDTRVTRNQFGMTNQRETSLLSDLPVLTRGTLHEYPQDFDQFVPNDWTTLGTGSVALVAGFRGSLAITTAATIGGVSGVQKAPAGWTIANGLRNWLAFISNLDSNLGSTIFGLVNATTTPFTGGSITDGAWVTTVAGVSTLNVAAGGVVTSQAFPGVLTANKFATLQMYWDGGLYGVSPGRFIAEMSGDADPTPSRVEAVLPAGFPSAANLSPILAVQATTAAARTLGVDLLYSAQDRLPPFATPAF